MTRRPRIARLIVCLLLAGATLLSTAAPLGAAARTPATAGDADRVRRELEDARRDLSQVEERETVTLADLRAVDARRTRLARELDRLGADLDDAERRQARAQRELAGTTARLLDVDRRVDDGRRRLRGQQAALRRTARTAYHYGAAAPLVLTAGDPGDFVRGLGYLRMANRARRSSMAAVQEVRAGLDESGAQLAVLRDRQADQRAALQGARAQVAGRLADRQRLGAELTQELDRHRTILAGIERDEAQVRALVDDLTAQDERIHAELAAAAQRAEIEAPPALAGGPSGGSSGPALTIPAARRPARRRGPTACSPSPPGARSATAASAGSCTPSRRSASCTPAGTSPPRAARRSGRPPTVSSSVPAGGAATATPSSSTTAGDWRPSPPTSPDWPSRPASASGRAR